MERRGLTPTELARSTSVSRTTWGRILSNEVDHITPATEKGICEFFNLSPLDLFSLIYEPEDFKRTLSGESPQAERIDKIGLFADWLRDNPQHQRLFFAMAENCGFDFHDQ